MQSYDYAAVMKRYDKGLQTVFKNINNYTEYVPCTAHSLNFVREKPASTVPEVVNYVGILQQLYVLYRCVRQSVYKHIMFFFWISLCLQYLPAFLSL